MARVCLLFPAISIGLLLTIDLHVAKAAVNTTSGSGAGSANFDFCSPSGFTVVEGCSARVCVRIDSQLSQDVSLSLNVSGGNATPGTDFEATNYQVAIVAGDVEGILAIPTYLDSDNGIETIFLTVQEFSSLLSGGTSTTTIVYITEDLSTLTPNITSRTVLSSTAASLSWSTPEGISCPTSVLINSIVSYYPTDNTGMTSTVRPTEPGISVFNLSPYTEYNFSVAFNHSSLSSTPYASVTLRTLLPAPSISNMTVTNTSIYLDWEAVSFALSYIVTVAGMTRPYFTEGSSRSISFLRPFTQYTVNVTGVDTFNRNGDSTVVMVRTKRGNPTVPRNVTLAPRSDISVEWFPPEVLGDDYVTYRATIQSVCGMTNVTTNGSSASFETSNDPEGVRYRLGVLAFNSVGESPEVVLMHSTQRETPALYGFARSSYTVTEGEGVELKLEAYELLPATTTFTLRVVEGNATQGEDFVLPEDFSFTIMGCTGTDDSIIIPTQLDFEDDDFDYFVVEVVGTDSENVASTSTTTTVYIREPTTGGVAVQFTSSSYQVFEGESAVITLQANKTTDIELVVFPLPVTSTADQDYVHGTYSFKFNNSRTATVSIPTIRNSSTYVTTERSFNVTFAPVNLANVSINTTSTTVFIVDYEAPIITTNPEQEPPPNLVRDSVTVTDFPQSRFNILGGSAFNLTCETNSENNTVTWHKDYSPSALPTSGRGYTIVVSGNRSNVVFSNFTTENTGVYQCIARMFSEVAHSRTVLLNTGRPSLRSDVSYYLLKEGRELNITINVTGSYSNITWYKNDTTLSINSEDYLYLDFGRVLQLNNGGLALVDYAGVYSVVVTSSSSESTYTSSRNFVAVLPEYNINVTSNNNRATLRYGVGESVELLCTSVSQLPQVLAWRVPTSVRPMITSSSQVNDSNASSLLMVPNDAVSGEYCCVVEVSLLSASSDEEECVNVTIVDPLVAISSSEVPLTPPETLSLRVEVDSAVITEDLVWEKDGLVLLEENSPQLIRRGTSTLDFGNYTVTATSTQGLEYQESFFVAAYVPLTVVPERTSVIVQLEDAPSTTVVLSCKVEGYPGPRVAFWLRVDEGGLLRPISTGATTSTLFGGNTTFPVVLLAQLTVDLTTSGVFTYMCGGVGIDEDGENVSAMSTITVRTITYPDPCPSAGCSHDCLPIGPGVFSCQCPLGSYLDSQDNKTCTANNPIVTPLVPLVQAVTGDYVTLTCTPSGLPLSQSAIRWRVNGTSLSNMRSISSGQPMMSVEQDLGLTLTLTRATPEMGGVYTCELVTYPNVSANITVTIAPGCFPTSLLTNAAVGSVVNVPCDSVHSGFNPGAAMTWKCTRHLNWEGEFSSCSFKENWQNPLVLLRYSVIIDLATALNNKSAFETSFQSYLTQQLGAGIDIVQLNIVRINRTETMGYIGFTLILEITPTSQFSALNNLDLNSEVPQFITIGNSRAFFDSSQSFNFVPSVNCSCPVLWVEIASLLGKRMRANVTLCRSPSYALSPCNCQDLFGERTCQCGELYTRVAGFCTLDVDQDRDPDFRDNCIGCCGAETYRGLVWPETPFETTVPISCGMQIDSSLNDFSYVTRYCDPSTGRWGVVDSTGCTATSNLTQALLIFQGTFDTRSIELSPREAVEAELRFYYNPYGLLEIRSIALSTIARTPVDSGGTQIPPNSQSLSETIVTVVVMAFPPNVSNRVLYADQADVDKRNVAGIYFRDKYVYGYRATDTCECANFPSEGRTFYSSCTGPPGNPCRCVSNDSLVEYGLVCECVDPYAPVTSEDRVPREIGSVTCAADDDGDRIPNSEDNCPSVYDPTNACLEPDSQALIDGCPEEVDSIWMISWPATPRATLNTQHCSNSLNATGGATGLATRMCGDDGVWRLPDVMNCRSLDFLLAEQNNLGANAVLANDPALNNGQSSEPVEISPGPFTLITTNTFFFVTATEPQERVLFPNDIGTINNFLSTVADYSEQTTLFNRTDYPEEDLLRIVDNVLETSTNESWRQLNEDPNNGGSPQLLESTERIALSFASNLRSNPNSETLEEGVLQRKVERRNAVFVGLLVEVDTYNQDLTITPSPGNTFQSVDLVPNISLPLQFLMERARSINSNYTPVVTSVISNLQQYLPLRYFNNTVPPNSTVGSILLSTQVSTFSGYSSTLQDNPITMKFPINRTYSSTPKTCVFWSFSSQNVSFGGWSDENVTTRSSQDASSDALCMSQHLTTFAVLVDVSGLTTQLGEQEALAFSIVSYIGCAISLVCLIATVVFLLTLRKEIITKVVNYVHLNLCIALICGLIVFLAGIQAGTSSRGGCAFVAFLLHYFFLAAFSWMLCEGIMLYNLLVKVFRANERKWIYIYTGLGWGIPVPFVILSLAIRWYIYRIPKSYDTTSSLYQELRACWLPHEEGVIAAFIVPMLIIIIINCVFIALAFKSLYTFKLEQTKRTDEEHAARKAGIALVKAFVIILPLLGLTWVIGLLAVNPYTTVFAWIFLFLNAFQGVFIFFFHVIRNDKVWPKLVGCLCGQKYKVTTTTSSTMKGKSSSGTSNSTVKFRLKDGLEMDTMSKDATTIENKMNVDDEDMREKAIPETSIPETSIPEREQVASTEPLMDEEENIK